MFLKKLILINWGNVPQLEYEFGPINLFSGGSGSGKTTAADAIQTLMTAAHDTLFTFNPGQEETTQRGRGGKQVRTLASYVLGCDDGSYARLRPTDCYIAGIFHPTSGEDSDPFTSVMAIRAHLDTGSKPAQARQSDLRFFIFPGEQLAIADFVREYKDGKHLLPLDKFYAVLGKQFEKVEQYDKRKPTCAASTAPCAAAATRCRTVRPCTPHVPFPILWPTSQSRVSTISWLRRCWKSAIWAMPSAQCRS